MTMTETEWRERFVKRLVELGLDHDTAQEICNVSYSRRMTRPGVCIRHLGFYDLTDDPEQAAEDEASYWQEDSPH